MQVCEYMCTYNNVYQIVYYDNFESAVDRK